MSAVLKSKAKSKLKNKEETVKKFRVSEEDLNYLNYLFCLNKGVKYEKEDIIKEKAKPQIITKIEKIVDKELTDKLENEVSNLKYQLEEQKKSNERKIISYLIPKINELEDEINSLNKKLSNKSLELERANEFFNIAIKASNLKENSIIHYILNLMISKEFKQKSVNIEVLKNFFGENFQMIDYLSERISSLEFQNTQLVSTIETLNILTKESIELNLLMEEKINESRNIFNSTLKSRTINNEFLDFYNKLKRFSNKEKKIEQVASSISNLKIQSIINSNKVFLVIPSKLINKDKFIEAFNNQIEVLENLKNEIHLSKEKIIINSNSSNNLHLNNNIPLSKPSLNNVLNSSIKVEEEMNVGVNTNTLLTPLSNSVSEAKAFMKPKVTKMSRNSNPKLTNNNSYTKNFLTKTSPSKILKTNKSDYVHNFTPLNKNSSNNLIMNNLASINNNKTNYTNNAFELVKEISSSEKTEEIRLLKKKYSNLKSIVNQIFLKYKNLIDETIYEEIGAIVNEGFDFSISFERKDFIGILVSQAKILEEKIAI